MFAFKKITGACGEWLYTDGKLWNWSQNYAVHLWYRTHPNEYSPSNIRCLNTTTGEILRHIYYGGYNFVIPCSLS